MSNLLLRSISMGGYGWFDKPDHSFVNDYLYVPPAPFSAQSNAWWFTSTGTDYITFFVSWWALQGKDSSSWPVPQTWQESWQQLSQENEQLKILDQQIHAARMQDKVVVLRLYHNYPLWASQGSNQGLQGNRYDFERLPTATHANSPFGWLLSYLICRYHLADPTPNPAGPLPSGRLTGNSAGARIDAIAPCNEPNLVGWGRPAHVAAAEMVYTAQAIQAYYGSPFLVLGPDGSDVPDEDSGGANSMHWQAFAQATMAYLAGWWYPSTYVGWSWHNYHDIRYYPNRPYMDMRAWTVRNLLYMYGWKGPNADRYVWLTEGGLNRENDNGTEGLPPPKPTMEEVQWAFNTWNLGQMHAAPDVVLWTNHCVRDGPSGEAVGHFDVTNYVTPWGMAWPHLPGWRQEEVDDPIPGPSRRIAEQRGPRSSSSRTRQEL